MYNATVEMTPVPNFTLRRLWFGFVCNVKIPLVWLWFWFTYGLWFFAEMMTRNAQQKKRPKWSP